MRPFVLTSMMPVKSSTADSLSQDTAKLLTLVASLRHSACAGCGRPICGHEAVFSVALGCQAMPRCLPCLAVGMEQSPEQLRDQLFDHVRRRDCFGFAWMVENQNEFPVSTGLPRCLWPAAPIHALSNELSEPAPTTERVARSDPQLPASQPEDEDLVVSARWDAGDLGCGDLVLELRGRLRELPPGSILELVALDPGARSDIPAWCGLTGHTLVRQTPPSFWIRRKEN